GQIDGAVGQIGQAVPTSGMGNGVNPAIALTAAGNPTAMWNAGGGLDFALGGAFAAGTGSLAGDGSPALASNVADPSGTTVAAWRDGNRVRIAHRVGNAFTASTFLSPSGSVGDAPTLAVNAKGAIFGAWIRDGAAEAATPAIPQ